MATLDQLSAALVKADAAGNADDARALAAEIRRMRAATPVEAPKDESFTGNLKAEGGRVADLAAGALRGAGSIGATLMYPIDKANDIIQGDRKELGPLSKLVVGKEYKPPLSRNEERRVAMTNGLESMGADPNSRQFGVGKIGAEIAGSMGAGGVVAKVVGAIPGAAPLAQSIASGGMTTGMPAGLASWLTRISGGAINGAATAGIVDPEQAGAGAAIGGALPVVAKASGAVGDAISRKMESGSKSLMQSAIKPTIKQLKSGDADTAVNTLLERGISPNEAGVNKLRALIDDLDTQVSGKIANSTATVDKNAVMNRLADTQKAFGNQVSPTADLKAIQSVGDDFMGHPSFPLPQTQIPVQAAQDLKRGTYQVLAKKYGQMGGAETEAQKALARGLKEEVASAVPEVAGLNAEMSKLITTLDVSERRALMEMNKNPMGLAALAGSPTGWAAFMADRSSAFKAIAARMLNASSGSAWSAGLMLGNSAANPLVRNALVRPITSESSP